MALTVQELISPELLGAARRIFGSVEGAIPVYLQENPGDARIGGGSAGPQTIQTLAIDSTIKPWMVAAFERLDALLDLDFAFTPTSNGSKINVYLDTLINLGGGGTTLGVALSNEFRRSSWWEIILNGPPLLKDEAYFKFAFVHELGHVLGLEHPFDGSDGDLGGERFGDPDASVTAMSYTKPQEGWPDFYTAVDLAALVSIWGLEQDTPAWLIRNANGEELLFELGEAENRLSRLLEGDALLGPAPAAPGQPAVSPLQGDPMRLVLNDLLEQASWEVSWDGGLSWQAGHGTELLLPGDTGPKQFNLRQRDRWGRLSPQFVGLVSPTQLLEVGPQLLLPASGSNGLLPLLTGPSGDAVLIWGMDTDLAAKPEQAAAIRAAVAELDAVVALDLQEKPVEPGAAPPTLLQLFFNATAENSATSSPGLIRLNWDRTLTELKGEPLRLNDRLQITLQPEAFSNEAALRRAVLHGLGTAMGLQSPPAGLLPETSLMVPIQNAERVGAASVTDLDQAALVALLGTEQHEANQADLAGLDTSPALLHIGEPVVSFRSDGTGRNWTLLELPVHRTGNLNLSVPLAWRAGDQQAALIVEPGQREAQLQLEFLSGQQQQLRLEVELPMQAVMQEDSPSTVDLNLHALEFGLSADELVNQGWEPGATPWSRGLITWNLAPELEQAWGDRLRMMLSELNQACGLEIVEVAATHPLLQWRFVAGTAAQRGLQSATTDQRVFSLGPDPAASALQGGGSQEQALLQAMLLELGLERPEHASDGDVYQRTSVYPEDSALFNAQRYGSSSVAALQPLDVEALRKLYGARTARQALSDTPPTLSLELITEQSGRRLSSNGLEQQLSLAVTRSGDLSEVHWLVVREDKLGWAEAINLEPGEAGKEIVLPWPAGPAPELSLELEVLSGSHEPASSAMGLHLPADDLMIVGQQLVPDPITGWTPDLNGDGQLQAELEGQLLLRFAFGTFPGESLTAELPWSTGQEAGADTNLTAAIPLGEVEQWLATGLRSGLPALNPASIMQILQFQPISSYPVG